MDSLYIVSWNHSPLTVTFNSSTHSPVPTVGSIATPTIFESSPLSAMFESHDDPHQSYLPTASSQNFTQEDALLTWNFQEFLQQQNSQNAKASDVEALLADYVPAFSPSDITKIEPNIQHDSPPTSVISNATVTDFSTDLDGLCIPRLTIKHIIFESATFSVVAEV
ncbi:hypothetical protein BC829DRAFT_202498 [Chytridium lagenaria]|nr:hypothetical protein BC829DRAFT_202498 [Chytridium lagenaria]